MKRVSSRRCHCVDEPDRLVNATATEKGSHGVRRMLSAPLRAVRVRAGPSERTSKSGGRS